MGRSGDPVVGKTGFRACFYLSHLVLLPSKEDLYVWSGNIVHAANASAANLSPPKEKRAREPRKNFHRTGRSASRCQRRSRRVLVHQVPGKTARSHKGQDSPRALPQWGRTQPAVAN